MKKILFLLLFIPTFLLAVDLTPSNWVNDYSGLLTQDEVNTLNNKISKFEKKTDIELTFAIVNSLDGRDIESYSNNLFKEWGVGKADRNNGILVVIAPNERKWRIEIGYGLEEYLTDYESSVYGDENFKPNFKEGNYFIGLDKFTTAIITGLGNKTWKDRIAYTKKQNKIREAENSNILWGILYTFLSIIGVIILIVMFKRFKNKLKLTEELKRNKLIAVDKYKNDIKKLNDNLRLFNRSEITTNSDIIKTINTSKDKSDLIFNGLLANNSLYEYNKLVESLFEMKTLNLEISHFHSNLNSQERLLNIKLSENRIVDTDINDDYRIVNTKIELSKDVLKIYKLKLEKINSYKSFNKKIDDSYLIESMLQKLDGKNYGANMLIVNDLNSQLSKVIMDFNSIDFNFDNFNFLKSAHDNYSLVKNDISKYFESIYKKNVEHNHMIEFINNDSKIKMMSNNLFKLSTHSDVTSSTKGSIKGLVSNLSIYRPTSDILVSFNLLNKLLSSGENLIRTANSDIEDEERKRRRKKREKEEDEERERRNSSSYGYGYGSSSSSDSGSSFGGFGGGDSGGGGSSGDF